MRNKFSSVISIPTADYSYSNNSNSNNLDLIKKSRFLNAHILARYNMINKKRAKSNGLHSLYIDPNLPVPDINERFVDACENGDYPTVTRILASIKDFNIDVTDNLGRTALRLAVENEHLEVVQALLGKSDSSKMREALLLAIYLGHIQIAESILRHPKYKVLNEKKFVNGDTDSFWQTPSSDDAQFPPDITPLMLASQYNRTEIVQILLINGDRITKPHDFHCKCNECFNRFKFDSLRHAQSRLNAYRGLASESYISLASMDPILTSFELGHELKMLSAKEKYFKNEYLQLADNLSAYVCKLLNNVRGRDELEIVLNKTGKETEEKYQQLARLDLAIKYEEKPFVAHSNCQQKLVEIWTNGIRKITKMNQLLVLVLLILYIFVLPFNIILYIIAPKTKFGKFLYQPCIKFITHTITYAIFIILIIVSSVQFSEEHKNSGKISSLLSDDLFENYSRYIEREDLVYRFNFTKGNFSMRSDQPSPMDIAITIWILGLIWQEIKNCFHSGVRDYLRSWNNIVNSLMNVLYIASFGLKYYTMIVVNLNKKKIVDNNFWEIALKLNKTDLQGQKEVYNTMYWLINDRFYWVSMDPINMAEGLFAVANLFSFTRICFLLPANQQLGPLQISLGNMISDIMKFVSIFIIIFLAFMFALNNLFWYYQRSTREALQLSNIDDNVTINAEENFGTILVTFKTMFWSLFGLGQPDFVLLSPYKNNLTEFFGTLLYALYHVASIIVLLNMLVASMTQSYEKILQESDIEWKFSRSKLYMEYIKRGGTLPVPFNIIPTPKSFYYLFKKLINICKKKEKVPNVEEEIEPQRPGRRNMNKNIDHLPMSINQKPARRASTVGDELTYIKVMQRIVKRFLLHKQRETDEVGEADFDELKQDLQMVRYEMVNDLKRTRDETSRLMTHVNNILLIIGEEIFKDSNTENLAKFKEYKTIELDSVQENSNDESKISQKGSFHFNRYGSSSVDSALHSIKDSTTNLVNSKSTITLNDKKIASSLESLGSSTDTQCSNEPNTEIVQINSSPNSETDISNSTSNNPPEIDLLDNQKLKGLSLNELQVINEEDEISDHSIDIIKHEENDHDIMINIEPVIKIVADHIDDNEKKFLF